MANTSAFRHHQQPLHHDSAVSNVPTNHSCILISKARLRTYLGHLGIYCATQ